MKTSFKLISFLLTVAMLVPVFASSVSALEKIVFIPTSEDFVTEAEETVEIADFRYEAAPLSLSADSLETKISTNGERYGRYILSQMENSQNLIAAYDIISEGIANLSSKIYLSYNGAYVSKSEFLSVYNIVLCDFPEYFWTGPTCSYATGISSYISYIAPSYVMSADEAKVATDELNEAVLTLTADLEGKSNYKKSKILHDKIALKVDYVSTDNDQTAYGALVEKQAVCAGYARAYQLLLQKCGIPAWTVTGSSLVPGTSESAPHAWNIVYLDGEWYHSDVTWDDQGNTTDYIFYAYFNMTTEQMFADHTPDADIAPYLPLCTATQNNFFKMKKWECDTFNKTIVKNSILSCGGYSRIYYTGDVDKFTEELGNNMYDIASNIGITGSYSYSILRLGNEIHVNIKSGYPPNGDANGDLKINVKDSLLLKKYLAGSEFVTEISMKNADMDKNGRITSLDIMKLRKKMNGA